MAALIVSKGPVCRTSTIASPLYSNILLISCCLFLDRVSTGFKKSERSRRFKNRDYSESRRDLEGQKGKKVQIAKTKRPRECWRCYLKKMTMMVVVVG